MTDQTTTNDQPPTDHTDQTPEVISLEEAATRLGISTNAVRQRIKRGTLTGDRTTTPWSVLWSPGRSRPTTGQPSTDQPTMESTTTTPDPRLAGIDAELAALRDERDWLRDRVEELTRTNLALISRLPAGDRPPDALEAATTRQDRAGGAERAAHDREADRAGGGLLRRFWRAWWHGERE
jgi:hypothetical protein